MYFHHQLDNNVMIVTDEFTYIDSFENFTRHRTAIGLAYHGKGEADELLYDPNRGRLTFTNGTQKFVKMKCDECDAILASVEALVIEREKTYKAQLEDPPMPDKKARAIAFLEQTAWLFTREQEQGVPMPPAVKRAREKAYAVLPEVYQISIPKGLL